MNLLRKLLASTKALSLKERTAKLQFAFRTHLTHPGSLQDMYSKITHGLCVIDATLPQLSEEPLVTVNFKELAEFYVAAQEFLGQIQLYTVACPDFKDIETSHAEPLRDQVFTMIHQHIHTDGPGFGTIDDFYDWLTCVFTLQEEEPLPEDCPAIEMIRALAEVHFSPYLDACHQTIDAFSDSGIMLGFLLKDASIPQAVMTQAFASNTAPELPKDNKIRKYAKTPALIKTVFNSLQTRKHQSHIASRFNWDSVIKKWERIDAAIQSGKISLANLKFKQAVMSFYKEISKKTGAICDIGALNLSDEILKDFGLLDDEENLFLTHVHAQISKAIVKLNPFGNMIIEDDVEGINATSVHFARRVLSDALVSRLEQNGHASLSALRIARRHYQDPHLTVRTPHYEKRHDVRKILENPLDLGESIASYGKTVEKPTLSICPKPTSPFDYERISLSVSIDLLGWNETFFSRSYTPDNIITKLDTLTRALISGRLTLLEGRISQEDFQQSVSQPNDRGIFPLSAAIKSKDHATIKEVVNAMSAEALVTAMSCKDSAIIEKALTWQTPCTFTNLCRCLESRSKALAEAEPDSDFARRYQENPHWFLRLGHTSEQLLDMAMEKGILMNVLYITEHTCSADTDIETMAKLLHTMIDIDEKKTFSSPTYDFCKCVNAAVGEADANAYLSELYCYPVSGQTAFDKALALERPILAKKIYEDATPSNRERLINPETIAQQLLKLLQIGADHRFIRDLIEAFDFDVNTKIEGTTLLVESVRHRKTLLYAYLIERGANPLTRYRDQDGFPALPLSAANSVNLTLLIDTFRHPEAIGDNLEEVLCAIERRSCYKQDTLSCIDDELFALFMVSMIKHKTPLSLQLSLLSATRLFEDRENWKTKIWPDFQSKTQPFPTHFPRLNIFRSSAEKAIYDTLNTLQTQDLSLDELANLLDETSAHFSGKERIDYYQYVLTLYQNHYPENAHYRQCPRLDTYVQKLTNARQLYVANLRDHDQDTVAAEWRLAFVATSF